MRWASFSTTGRGASSTRPWVETRGNNNNKTRGRQVKRQYILSHSAERYVASQADGTPDEA